MLGVKHEDTKGAKPTKKRRELMRIGCGKVRVCGKERKGLLG
jgi:hypothetical protein